MVEVWEKIKAYIKEKHISQRELALRIGISECKLSLALSGKRRLTFDEYQAICWALGVGVGQFIEPRAPGTRTGRT